MTLGAFADRDCARLLETALTAQPPVVGGEPPLGKTTAVGESDELIELFDDMAAPIAPMPGAKELEECTRPLRNGGGSYVTPNSGC